jgi:hypothetical protein
MHKLFLLVLGSYFLCHTAANDRTEDLVVENLSARIDNAAKDLAKLREQDNLSCFSMPLRVRCESMCLVDSVKMATILEQDIGQIQSRLAEYLPSRVMGTFVRGRLDVCESLANKTREYKEFLWAARDRCALVLSKD